MDTRADSTATERSKSSHTVPGESRVLATGSCHPGKLTKSQYQSKLLISASMVKLIRQYIALQILEKLIQTRWKALPPDQQSGIRNFIVQVTVEVSSDEARMRREKGYLNKLNLVLVQVRLCSLQSDHELILRFSNKHGPKTGLPSSPKSSHHHVPTSPSAKTTWSSSNSCRKRSSTFQQNK